MIQELCCLLGLVFSVSLAAAQTVSSDNSTPRALKKIATIELTGAAGKRFDYLTIDYQHGYLLSSHLGADVTYVINLKTNALVKTIHDTPGAEGIEYVPEFNKVYTSNWKDHTIGVIDLGKMEVVRKIPAKEKPDGSAYAADFKKLYVSDERAKELIVVDVTKDKPTGTIPFESETGMPQYDSVAKKIYVNLQDLNLFAVIDPASDSVVGEYPIREGAGNHGMALDLEHRLAFLVCEGSDQLVVFSLTAYKPVASSKIPPGGDVVKYDSGLRRVYVACYSGYISVFQVDDAAHIRKLEDVPVQKKVHSLAVDVVTHRVYAPEQEADGKPVSRMIVYDAVGK